jgi:hypothetical protein
MNYHLTNFYQRMKEVIKENDYFIDLSDLMTQNLPLVIIKDFVPEVATNKLKVSVIDQRLRFRPTVKDGEAIDFVLDSKFRLYLGIGHLKLTKKVNEIVVAGQVKCQNEQIYYINNWSIQYETEYKNFIDFVKEFRKLDFVIADLKVEYYDFN